MPRVITLPSLEFRFPSREPSEQEHELGAELLQRRHQHVPVHTLGFGVVLETLEEFLMAGLDKIPLLLVETQHELLYRKVVTLYHVLRNGRTMFRTDTLCNIPFELQTPGFKVLPVTVCVPSLWRRELFHGTHCETVFFAIQFDLFRFLVRSSFCQITDCTRKHRCAILTQWSTWLRRSGGSWSPKEAVPVTWLTRRLWRNLRRRSGGCRCKTMHGCVVSEERPIILRYLSWYTG